jgi:hypothetical protein
MAGQYKFTLEKYASFTVPIVWYQSDGVTPVNITGWTAKLEVKDYTHALLIVTFTTADGSITLGGTNGTITLNMSATATGALQAGYWDYDLVLTGTTQSVRLLEGAFEILEAVTDG